LSETVIERVAASRITLTDGVAVLRFGVFDGLDWLRHGVSTRVGGQSREHLASLNLSFAVSDEPDTVVANRQRFCGALDVDLDRAVCAVQTHGTNVAEVGLDDRGRGVFARGTGIPDTDAIVTDEPGVFPMLSFADCVPIVFVDPDHRAVGVAHAGWKGTVNGVVASTVAKMIARYDSRPERLLVAIGPSIGPCCYEVGPEVVDSLEKRVGDTTPFLRPRPTGRPHLDLWQANRHWLWQAGIPEPNVETVELCTACRTELFYSHRREGGRTGRFAVLAGRHVDG
jgi:polyphenol oxidase